MQPLVLYICTIFLLHYIFHFLAHCEIELPHLAVSGGPELNFSWLGWSIFSYLVSFDILKNGRKLIENNYE